MRKHFISLVILSFLVGLLFPYSSNANGQVDSPIKKNAIQEKVHDKFQLDKNAKYKPGQVIVKFKNNTPSKKVLASLKSYKSQQLKKNAYGSLVVSVPDGKNLEDFINELLKDPTVEVAQPNYKYSTFSVPNDEFYSNQQWYFDRLKVSEAWDKVPQSQSPVVVAVIDNGVNTAHPDLRDNIVTDNFNAYNSSVFLPNDNDGHGTMVAGVIGATINNSIGVSGISPNVKILPVNVFSGDNAYADSMYDGLHYAIQQGAKVINMSLGSYGYDVILKGIIDDAYKAGIVVVAAAGNDNVDIPVYPASYANVISVGATDQNDSKASFSNYGSTIDIVAPGVDIWSTMIDPSKPADNYAGYGYANGTSLSSPLVAGTAALILAKDPSLSVDDVTNILLHSARDIGNSGVDDTSGYGILDVSQALNMVNMYDSDQFEENNSLNTAKLINLGTKLEGSLSSPNDADFFKFTVTTRQRVKIRVTPQLDEDIVLQLYGQTGGEIVINADVGQIGDQYYEGGIEEFNLILDPATYYIKVSDSFGSTQFRPYSLETFIPSSERIAGRDRFETAIKVSQKGWSSADTVVLAYYNGFADALAGVPLAYKNNGPVLLTETNRLTTATKSELTRLKTKKVIIVGGTGVISSNVENELKSMGLNVSRLGGRDRFDTARLIANAMGTADSAVIAYGMNFPDALAAAPYAAHNGYPILLVETNRIPAYTFQALSEKGIKNTVIVGGTGIVSDQVFRQLPNPYRIAGQNRFQTAVEIIRKVNAPTEHIFMATGLNFADALTGAVLAAKNNSPLLLTLPNEVPADVKGIINERNVLNFTILGGTGVVSDAVNRELLK